MAKVGNESRLILSLARERMGIFRKECVAKTWPTADKSPEALKNQAKNEGIVRGIDEYERVLCNIVSEIESR